MPELMTQIEENYQRWQEENKSWPKQRNEEFSKVQKYLSVQQENAVNRSQWSRLSFETTTVMGTALYQPIPSMDPAEDEKVGNAVSTDLWNKR